MAFTQEHDYGSEASYLKYSSAPLSSFEIQLEITHRIAEFCADGRGVKREGLDVVYNWSFRLVLDKLEIA